MARGAATDLAADESRRGRDDLSDDDPNGQEQVSYSV
jgi:hypothetical protein